MALKAYQMPDSFVDGLTGWWKNFRLLHPQIIDLHRATYIFILGGSRDFFR